MVAPEPFTSTALRESMEPDWPLSGRKTGPDHPPERIAPVAVGRVWLVGAGPGAPDLLTMRALRCLESAEVVVHDRLVPRAIIQCAAPLAERIDVGKRPFAAGYTQAEINALLIDRARIGKRVVRLKGGDPFVFGRGAEEARALACAGVPFEVIPGLSSALCAPLAAGIPLTDRDVAHSFTVATATAAGGAPPDDYEMRALASTPGTLVLLMGVRNLKTLVNCLLRAGRPAYEPSALVMHATWPTQRILKAPLRDMVELARLERVTPPAVLVVGPSVDLAVPHA